MRVERPVFVERADGSGCSVGIGGHASHGGYGFDSRLWGLTLDTVVGLDVVLANGSFVHASAEENTDLYFVCPTCPLFRATKVMR